VSTALKLLRKKISLYIMTHNLRAKSLRWQRWTLIDGWTFRISFLRIWHFFL
jgi:hypothetical protein